MASIHNVSAMGRFSLPTISAHDAADRTTLERHQMKGPYRLDPGPDAFSFALFQSVGVGLAPGHALRVIQDGDVFDALVEEIGRARESVHILVYIWRPSPPSDRVIEALTARARDGVRCRIVVDPVGSEEVTGHHDFDEQVEKRLRSAGCEVHYYRLLGNRRFHRMLGRDHQKLAVVDGRVAITGGFGIWKVWQGHGNSPEEWRETSIRVEGPAVRDVQLAFSSSWQEAGGELLPADVFPELAPAGPARAGFVSSTGRPGISDAERMTRLVVAAATRRLWIANAYFTPPDAILRQLEVKARDGVDVRVLAPGPVHDVPLIRASQRSTYERLLRAGVRIWEYQASMLHAKTMLVDDWLSVVGSTNLDPMSLNWLGEGSLVVADSDVAAELERAWPRDLARSREITLRDGGRTGPWRRFARRATLLIARD
jgi:cardiolipin synthase